MHLGDLHRFGVDLSLVRTETDEVSITLLARHAHAIGNTERPGPVTTSLRRLTVSRGDGRTDLPGVSVLD
jgi:hypothetical protein